MLRVVRRLLHRWVRSKLDSCDITQEIWQAFFRDALKKERFENPERLIAFLTGMARHKVLDAHRRYHQQTRDARRERPLEDSGAEAVPTAKPGPDDRATAWDDYERRLEGEPTCVRVVVRLLGAGWTIEEIAAKLQTDEKTVRHLIRRACRRAHAAVHA